MPLVFHAESLLDLLSKIETIYSGCSHVSPVRNVQRKSYKTTGFFKPRCGIIASKSEFCENIDFDSKFGSLSLGHGWYRAKSTQRNVIHIFHESWSKFKPMKSIDDVHLNYGVIRDIQQRTIIATEVRITNIL